MGRQGEGGVPGDDLGLQLDLSVLGEIKHLEQVPITCINNLEFVRGISRFTFTVEDVEDAVGVRILLRLETVCSIATSVGDKYAEGGQGLRGQRL